MTSHLALMLGNAIPKAQATREQINRMYSKFKAFVHGYDVG